MADRPHKPSSHKQRHAIPRLDEQADAATFFQQDGTTVSGFAEALASGLGAETPETSPADTVPHDTAAPLGERLKGYPPPQAEYDCHGLTAVAAEKALRHFLAQADRSRLRTVRIVTGKGLHSPNGPVLRDLVEGELRLLKKQGAILAFRWEKKEKERSGSVIVYL